jgi:hypothetical protein
VIPYKFARPSEAGGLDEGAPEILRGAQDDSRGGVILSTAKDLWRT